MPDSIRIILIQVSLFLFRINISDGNNNTGFFHTANVTMTQGLLLSGDDLSPEGVAAKT